MMGTNNFHKGRPGCLSLNGRLGSGSFQRHTSDPCQLRHIEAGPNPGLTPYPGPDVAGLCPDVVHVEGDLGNPHLKMGI